MEKTVFITGGASGIGEAAVRKFLAEGWNVGFMDIDGESGRRLAGELDASSRLVFTEGDTRSHDAIRKAVDATVNAFGALHSVFANAGIHRSNTLLDISDDELKQMIDINIYGNVNTLREAVPHIIKARGGSVVINVSDQWFVGKPHSFAYGLTKGALGQITRSLAIDLGPEGIRVNAVCAGTIRTPLADNALRNSAAASGRSLDESWEEENRIYMRGRAGDPAEVAELVYFLASDKSSFCTGGHYLIDGGLVAQ